MAIWVRFQTGGHWKFYTHLCALQESTCTRFLRAEKKKKEKVGNPLRAVAKSIRKLAPPP